MRIKSNFKDYYDGFQAQDTDHITLWIRETKNVPVVLDKNTPKNIKNFFEDAFSFCKTERDGPSFNHYHWLVLGIAGKIHVAWVYCNRKKTINFDQDTQPKYEWYQFNWHHTKQNPWYKIYCDDIKLTEYLFETYGPTWCIGNGVLYENVDSVTINPCLTDWGIHKVLPVHEVYNELYKFVCNMQRPVRPIPEMSNDVKIHQAGFDTKTSFRKAKSAPAGAD